MTQIKKKVQILEKQSSKKSKWWLWLIAALVVVAGVIICLLATGDSSSTDQEKTEEITPQQQIASETPAQPAGQVADTLKPETKPATPPIPYKQGEAYKVYLFPFGDGTYSQSNPELDQLVDVLTKNPDVKIQINAYTDKVGSVAYNQALSTKRAKAIYDYLLSKGIDKSRLSYQGKGISTQYGSDAENRRAEFILK
jgi:outer membrane protein OmpA-like peptidoglycan-associated protein